jgi:hypothetical protein
MITPAGRLGCLFTAVATIATAAGCSSSVTEPVEIKANQQTLALVKVWGPDVCFFTRRARPARSLSGLVADDVACSGIEFFDKMNEFLKAAGIESSGKVNVRFGTPLAEKPPGLYVTWCTHPADDLDELARATLVPE